MQAANSCRRFRNLMAVVIGGGSGLGKATSKRLAAEAAHVLVADINLKAAEKVAEDIKAAGGSAETARVDIMQSQQVQQLFPGQAKGVNVLVNSAGSMWYCPINEITPDDMRRAYGPSVDGLLVAMQEATKALQRRSSSKSLSIVNISSTTSSIALPKLASYSSAKLQYGSSQKALLWSMLPCMSGCRVNGVNTVVPHTTNTEGVQAFAASLPQEDMNKVTAVNMPKLIPRLAEPEEIAAGIAFLASSDASFMTGTELIMDGGACIT
ncbi:hypothetical protein WJX74_005536 [Apatococcus lobatus]|uniref:Uncharacterized protein n=1 Tax=Apatococcus lobatus TaxID=904363 RepID=A0AAW1RL21_9CHLO